MAEAPALCVTHPNYAVCCVRLCTCMRVYLRIRAGGWARVQVRQLEWEAWARVVEVRRGGGLWGPAQKSGQRLPGAASLQGSGCRAYSGKDFRNQSRANHGAV